MYDLDKDSWSEIAKLPKPLLSSSIIVVEQKYTYRVGDKESEARRSVLFAFGGVSKLDNQLDFCPEVYRIVLGDLSKPGSIPLKNSIWMTLNI